MAQDDLIDTSKLTQRELLLRLDERQKVMNDLFKTTIEGYDKKFIGIYRTQSKLQTALAVLTVRVLLLSGGASVLVALIMFLIKSLVTPSTP